MMSKTHVVIGIAYGTALIPAVQRVDYSIEQFGLMMAGLVIGSLLPDLDHPQSTISRSIPLVGGIISRLTRHRGLFHSILGAAAFYILMLFPLGFAVELSSTQYPFYLGTGLIIGYILHIVADMLTVSGVRLFYPLRRTIRIPLFRTGGYREGVLRIALIVISAMQIIALFID